MNSSRYDHRLESSKEPGGKSLGPCQITTPGISEEKEQGKITKRERNINKFPALEEDTTQ